MKSIIFCLACMVTSVAFGQSKKELQGQVDQLKTQLTQLKAENLALQPKEVNLTDIHKKASYGLGVLMATNIQKQGGDSLDVTAMNAAITDVFEKKTLKMDEQASMMLVQEYMQKAMDRKAIKAKSEGQEFLEKNKTADGVVVTKTGLQYKILTSGKGKAPLASSSVTVHYTGKLVDGTTFDSSIDRGQPATFTVNQVIPGWTEALQLMHEGDRWMLYIPSDLGYGERGAGGQIPPHAALIFEVELIKVN